MSFEITSATTVTTVKYLSLYELKNYKKQFQSFWLPFMEQFVPATTIWVAGERWCNEPCTIIDSCDYDFELTSANVTTSPLVPISTPTLPLKPYTNNTFVIDSIESTVTTNNILPSANIPTNTPSVTPTIDLGDNIYTPIVLSEAEQSIDTQSYRNKFTTTQTELSF